MAPIIVGLANGVCFVVEIDMDVLLRDIVNRRGTSQPFVSLWTMCSDCAVWRRKNPCYIDVNEISSLERHELDLPKEGTF